MRFGPDHYVPILKLKRGEKRALASITPVIAARMTPLLEVVEMTGAKALAEHVNTAFKDLSVSVGQFRRYFLDAHEISGTGAAGATLVFQMAAAIGHPFTPVTGISRTADVAAALGHRQMGIAVRVTRQEFEDGRIPGRLPRWLAAQKLSPEEIDLIIDLGAVDDMVAAGVAALSRAFLADVPHHTRWRTLTLSACAFPASMGVVNRHSHVLLDRIEWQAWRDELYAVRTNLARLPTFSDGAIQHPHGVEGFDPKTMQVSASVRYTLPERWLLIKGESTRNVPPSEQFPKLAIQLAYGHLADHFAGPSHCKGCQGIQDAADGFPGFGAPETWRRLGTIHHLTQTVESLAGLTWP